MELDAVEPLLQELEGGVRHVVVERLVEDFAVLVDDADDAGPLADEEPAGAVVRAGDVDRVDEPAGDFDELDRRRCRGACRRGGRRGSGPQTRGHLDQLDGHVAGELAAGAGGVGRGVEAGGRRRGAAFAGGAARRRAAGQGAAGRASCSAATEEAGRRQRQEAGDNLAGVDPLRDSSGCSPG